jgi:hypothetical protein
MRFAQGGVDVTPMLFLYCKARKKQNIGVVADRYNAKHKPYGVRYVGTKARLWLRHVAVDSATECRHVVMT